MTRTVTEEGRELVRKWESFAPKVYICPAGYPTIGYGHVVKPVEKDRFAGGITRLEAQELLKSDLRTAENAVLRYITVALDDGQFNALVSFTFNLGAGALQASTLRKVINRGDYEEAPEQFKRWVNAGGKKLKGLVRRRQEEADMFANWHLYDHAREAAMEVSQPEEPPAPTSGLASALSWLLRSSPPPRR